MFAIREVRPDPHANDFSALFIVPSDWRMLQMNTSFLRTMSYENLVAIPSRIAISHSPRNEYCKVHSVPYGIRYALTPSGRMPLLADFMIAL